MRKFTIYLLLLFSLVSCAGKGKITKDYDHFLGEYNIKSANIPFYGFFEGAVLNFTLTNKNGQNFYYANFFGNSVLLENITSRAKLAFLVNGNQRIILTKPTTHHKFLTGPYNSGTYYSAVFSIKFNDLVKLANAEDVALRFYYNNDKSKEFHLNEGHIATIKEFIEEVSR